MAIRYPIILLIVLVSSALAGPFPDYKAIKQFPLDERTVYQIKVSKNQVTTIMFPGAITALEGAGIATDSQTPGAMLLNYAKGRYFFSIRALQEPATANLNVVWNRKTYVLQFLTDKEPFNSVTFYEPINPVGSLGQGQGTGPTKLLSLLDRAKSYHLIQAQYPEAVPQVDTSTPNRRMLYKDFNVEITEVFRFDPEDTLVFKLLFYNNSDKEIFYQPQALAVRVGNNVYFSSLSDASGIMPPGSLNPKTKKIQPSASLAYFAIVGAPDGGRNNISVNNAFNIIVSRQSGEVNITRP